MPACVTSRSRTFPAGQNADQWAPDSSSTARRLSSDLSGQSPTATTPAVWVDSRSIPSIPLIHSIPLRPIPFLPFHSILSIPFHSICCFIHCRSGPTAEHPAARRQKLLYGTHIAGWGSALVLNCASRQPPTGTDHQDRLPNQHPSASSSRAVFMRAAIPAALGRWGNIGHQPG